jgi:cytochrome b involved in lipid metabolism
MKKTFPFLVILFTAAIFIGCTANPGDATTPEVTTDTPVVYTAAEVAEHKTKNDCWTINSGKVYDITSFLDIHPGGADKIIQACGKDSTALFQSVPDHVERGAPAQLAAFQIGVLAN